MRLGSLFTFLVSVSISWSNILKFIFPEGSSTTYFYIITFIFTLLITFIYFCFSVEIQKPILYLRRKNLSCCHWNGNSLIAHNLSKIPLLEAYNVIYKHDFLCISETYFDSSVLEGDKNIQLIGFNMNRAEHPSNAKRGGVCIFYNETLGVRVVNTHQILLNALFLKYLFKIIKVILVLHIDLQAKILLSFNFLIKF